jgi:hypothetical protein
MSDPCSSVVHYICAASITLALISIAISAAHIRWSALNMARARRERAATLRRLAETRIAFSDETAALGRRPVLPPAPR